MQLALEARENDDLALCLRSCECAATNDEFIVLALHLKGFVIRQQGDWSGACRVFEEALTAAFDGASLWHDLENTREALQQWDEAQKWRRRAHLIDAEDEDAPQGMTRAARQRAQLGVSLPDDSVRAEARSI